MRLIETEKAQSLFEDCLCHLRIDVLGRGSPSDMAMVYKVGADERSKWLQALEEVRGNPDSSSSEQVGRDLVQSLTVCS